MEIKPAYITFEQAKLLKEKGFDIDTYSNCWVKTLDGEIIHNSERRNCIEHDRCETYLMQPEHWQVSEWLRVKHNLWPSVMYMGAELKWSWSVDVITTTGTAWDSHGPSEEDEKDLELRSSSPQEAYSAALDYILTSLL